MKNQLLTLLLLTTSFIFSQEKVLYLKKTDISEFILDGILSENELKNSSEIDII